MDPPGSLDLQMFRLKGLKFNINSTKTSQKPGLQMPFRTKHLRLPSANHFLVINVFLFNMSLRSVQLNIRCLVLNGSNGIPPAKIHGLNSPYFIIHKQDSPFEPQII